MVESASKLELKPEISLADLLASPSLRQQEFPITARKVFMAHAAVSPLPNRVSTAISDYVQCASTTGQWEYLYADIEKEARFYAARLLNAAEDEIAFVSSTSMGLSLIASGLEWEAGQNVVVADGDFPSNIYPWLNLERRGVNVRFIPRKRYGMVTLEDVQNIINEKTRLVSLSSVNFVTGFKLDVSSIGEYLSQRNIMFCIDGVQSLGALPIDIRYVDCLASSSHKWLLGPLGIGILYIKKKHLGTLTPVLAGWKCVQSNKNYLSYNLCFQDSARCFEPGGMNVLGMEGLRAALKLLLDIGIESIARRLAGFRQMMFSTLNLKGYDVISPAEQGSAIVSFTSRKLDIVSLRNELDNDGFVVSLRDTLEGGKCIRISPHFYNTEDEILSFLDRLPNL